MKVTNIKPNVSIREVKPKMAKVQSETTVYLESRTINKGQPIGLLLTLTYPEQLTFMAIRK